MKRLILMAGLAGCLAACHNATQQETTAAEAPVAGHPTDTAATDGLTGATAKPNVSAFNGLLIVPPGRHATLTAVMGGTVHSTTLLPGARVDKGQVVATLANPEFIRLQQEYLEAQAQTEYLEADYRRQQQLTADGASPQKRLQQSKADYLSMKSRMAAAAAQLRLLGVDAARLTADGLRPYLEITSPVSGYATRMELNVGKHIAAGEPVCDVISKSETLLQLTAYEKDLARLEPGKELEFRVNGMEGDTFSATLLSVDQTVDPTNRSVKVYARVQGSHPQFRPGMYVNARIKP